jgi:hypothetical protein
MPRKKKLSPAEQAAREAEILNAPIDTSNETIKALMSPEFEKMSNLDASQIALLLQELVRGQNSLLANAEQNSIEIARLRERQDQADRDVAERLASQQKFIEEVLDRAEKIKRTGEAQDRLIANGVAEYQKAKVNAVAEIAASNLAFRKKLQSEKKVMVISPGQLVTTMQHGQQVSQIIPEEIHVKDIHMRLPVGKPIELPETLARLLEDRRRSQEETAKRAELLGKNLEASELAKAWNQVEGSKTEAMPL